ncbi:MAG: glutamate--tRNA ligase [Phycisphaerae bacterium]|nr:glutamate--tRNA ligase [Phycisphaerae bacterium]
MKNIRTRFAPSPTGSLHVGGARTALFNYALAKQAGGTFILRIEDTDRARHQEDAVAKIIEDLRWLGIEWDEGIEKSGPAGPYRQSERLNVYQERIQTLLDEHKAYYAFESADELDAQRKEAEKNKQNFLYRRENRDPSDFPSHEDADQARRNGKPVVVRLLNPLHDVTITDEIFGDVTIPADQQDDFIIQKADGWPTYHLANVVDDAAMGVNFILRGQEFLGQSWRHKLLREAFGYDEPKYAHLPLIMDMQGRKLSKRDGDVEVDSFRRAGYLPETMVNFIALLGWNPGDDRETFSLSQFVELFDVSRVGKSNAKFDRAKLLAFNTAAVAAASEDRLLAGFRDFLARNETPFPANDDETLRRVLRACAGFRIYADIVDKCGVLFGPDDAFDYDEKAVQKVLAKNNSEGYAMLEAIKPELANLDWTAEAIETWMHTYCEKHELGMGKIAQPIRVAVTGKAVSPGLGETLTFLGKEKTLARIDRCLVLRSSR